MAKKNRTPRPQITEEYVTKGEFIPGTDIISTHDGWCYPVWFTKLPGFSRRKYRQWVRAKEDKWEKEHAAAVVTNP